MLLKQCKLSILISHLSDSHLRKFCFTDTIKRDKKAHSCVPPDVCEAPFFLPGMMRITELSSTPTPSCSTLEGEEEEQVEETVRMVDYRKEVFVKPGLQTVFLFVCLFVCFSDI